MTSQPLAGGLCGVSCCLSCGLPRHRTLVISGAFVAYVRGGDRWSWFRSRSSRSAGARRYGRCARHPPQQPRPPRTAKLYASCHAACALHSDCGMQTPSLSPIVRPCLAIPRRSCLLIAHSPIVVLRQDAVEPPAMRRCRFWGRARVPDDSSRLRWTARCAADSLRTRPSCLPVGLTWQCG